MKRLLFSLLLAAPFTPSQAGNWPQWRGPDFDGSSAEVDLPVEFSQTSHVAWSAPMPGPAASTPVVWGGDVFLSSTNEKEQKLLALCLDAKTGAVKWQKAVGDGFKIDDKSTLASPSPVTDGKLVYFYYGTGDLAAFDFTGKEVWKKNIQKEYGTFATQWTYSTSPMLSEGRLYIQVLQRNHSFKFGSSTKGRDDGPNDSYLLAMDPATGKELWRQVRPAQAVEESLEAFTTPVPFKHDNRKEILVAGGDCLTGHDPATGKELWRWGTWNPTKIGHWRLVVSPVGGGGVVLACAPKQSPVYAVKAGATGTLKDDQIAWRTKLPDEETASPKEKGVSSDVATPLFYNGHFYILNGDKKTLACVKPDGTVLWNEEIGGKAKIEASPTAGDGKIYFIDHAGDVFIVKANPQKFELLGKAEMASRGTKDIRSCVALANGNLYIRTHEKLFCIKK